MKDERYNCRCGRTIAWEIDPNGFDDLVICECGIEYHVYPIWQAVKHLTYRKVRL